MQSSCSFCDATPSGKVIIDLKKNLKKWRYAPMKTKMQVWPAWIPGLPGTEKIIDVPQLSDSSFLPQDKMIYVHRKVRLAKSVENKSFLLGETTQV